MMRRVAGIVLALATIIASPALAGDYPNKPIKMISDSAPGSAVDVSFRMVMDRLGAALGQQIIPIDQPGAGGAIAAHAASESIADGYTLFAPALSLFISLPGKADNLPLILPRDFLPVGSLAQLSVFICASPQSGINTLPDLIARAKERPGEIAFAATGIGRITHLTGLLLQSRAGITLQTVPYAGGPAAALTDVIGGRVPLIIEGYGGLAGAITAHKVNVLAVASAHRLPDFSDVPTRRKFINSDKSWVFFGQYGDIITPGNFPLVWNTVQVDNGPSDFIFGYGQDGGAAQWSVVATGDDPTTSEPYPAMSFDVCATASANNQRPQVAIFY